MDSQDAMAMVTSYGCRVFDNQHFVYKSGKHGPAYANVDPVLYKPQALWNICGQMAQPWLQSPASPYLRPQIDLVASPAVGGISFGLLVALIISQNTNTEVHHVFCEKTDTTESGFAFQRTNFAEECRGKNVLVVEDILNSGVSTGAVIDCVRAAGGNVVGVCCFVSRGGATAQSLGVTFFDALIDIDMVQYEADVCPLCETHVPMVVDSALGKGSGWRKDNPTYPGGFVELLS